MKELKHIKSFNESTENSNSKSYTRDEVFRLLEDLFENVAYLYNDYGKTDFSKESVEYVKNYMIDK